MLCRYIIILILKCTSRYFYIFFHSYTTVVTCNLVITYFIYIFQLVKQNLIIVKIFIFFVIFLFSNKLLYVLKFNRGKLSSHRDRAKNAVLVSILIITTGH